MAVFLVLAFAFSCHAQQPPGFTGTYIFTGDNKIYITFYPNGTFFMKQRKPVPDSEDPFMDISGKYVMKGEEVTLITDDGGESTVKYKEKENRLEDSDGKAWMKQGTSSPPTFLKDEAKKNRRF
jgi:hypothetical protein